MRFNRINRRHEKIIFTLIETKLIFVIQSRTKWSREQIFVIISTNAKSITLHNGRHYFAIYRIDSRLNGAERYKMKRDNRIKRWNVDFKPTVCVWLNRLQTHTAASHSIVHANECVCGARPIRDVEIPKCVGAILLSFNVLFSSHFHRLSSCKPEKRAEHCFQFIGNWFFFYLGRWGNFYLL